MDSAKIFALGLAAGLAIHALMRNRAKQASNQPNDSIASKSSKKNKKTKRTKDAATVPDVVNQPAPTHQPVVAQTASQKKKVKKQQQQQQQTFTSTKQRDPFYTLTLFDFFHTDSTSLT